MALLLAVKVYQNYGETGLALIGVCTYQLQVPADCAFTTLGLVARPDRALGRAKHCHGALQQ